MADPDNSSAPRTQWSQDHGNAPVSDAELSQGRSARLIAIDREDMTAGSYRQLERLARRNGLSEVPPVYVDSEDLHSREATQLLFTREGRPYIVMNSPAFKMSEQFVRDNLEVSNADLDRGIRDGRITEITRENATGDRARLYENYERMARTMGLSSTPALYIDHTDQNPVPNAAARMSQEGRMYIVMNDKAFTEWNERQLTAILAHELDHIARGDVTPRAAVTGHNNNTFPARERRADIEGSGPRGSNDPQSLREAVDIMARLDREFFLKNRPSATLDDYNEAVSRTHPLPEARDEYLDRMVRRQRSR